jgi:hypothetical protein
MMISRLDSARHEAQDPESLLLLGQEVLLMHRAENSSSWAHRNALQRHRAIMVQRNAAGSLRVSLNFPFILPPRLGGRGLKTVSSMPTKVAR